MTSQRMSGKQPDRARNIFGKDRLIHNDEGVAGYFEDLPKLLFILFAVGIFITSTITVYGAYNRFNEDTMMVDSLNAFSNEIVTWDRLTLDQEGVLNGAAFDSTSVDDWEDRFSPKVKHFEYQIMVWDRSLYDDRQDFEPISTEDRPYGTDIYSKTIPVLVQDADGNYRASYLIVAIWR